MILPLEIGGFFVVDEDGAEAHLPRHIYWQAFDEVYGCNRLTLAVALLEVYREWQAQRHISE